ncbi:TPA: hypothetical protein ACPY9J_002258 [Yersinia enterocolitica]
MKSFFSKILLNNLFNRILHFYCVCKVQCNLYIKALLISFIGISSSRADGSTLAEMVKVSSEQASQISQSLPIFFWLCALVLGASAIALGVKKNAEKEGSRITWVSIIVLFILAGLFASVGFMVKTAANSIGADSTTY